MKKALIVSILTIGTFTANAQSKTAIDSVKEVITTLFTAMRNADSTGIMKCFAPGSHMETISKTKSQSDTVRSNTVEAFASSITKQDVNALDEQIQFDQVQIDANLAQVWTPYKFYFKGNFSH